MTKINRERAYLNFRDLEKNYVALDDLNSGLTSTTSMRERAKENADAMLLKNPELGELEKPVYKEEKPVEEEVKSKRKK